MSENALTTIHEFTPEQIKLVKDTVAKGATDDELKLFIYRCKNMGLDPLKPGQVHFVKYGNSPGTTIVGIDGFRTRAMKSGKLAGIMRGIINDDKGKLVGAWAEVYRHDWTKPARDEAFLSEYSTGKGMWLKMPITMLKKVAEVAALRMAFPDELGGMYSHEEMDQAKEANKNTAPSIAPDQPSENDGVTPQTLRIRFGKYAGRHPSEVPRNDLEDYFFSLEERFMNDPKLANDIRVKETIDFIGGYLENLEKDIEVIKNESNTR